MASRNWEYDRKIREMESKREKRRDYNLTNPARGAFPTTKEKRRGSKLSFYFIPLPFAYMTITVYVFISISKDKLYGTCVG